MSEADTVNHDARDQRIGQLLNDYLDRQARGEAEAQALFLARHPDLADDLRSHLDLLCDLQPQQATLEGLIGQGILEACDEPCYAARLGAYRISRFVGRGGMGLVLKAHEESLDRTVALKILRPELAEDQAALARFKREAQAAAALRHPNIVTVHAVGQQGPVHFLAMEYIDGPTLADLIRSGDPRGTGFQPVEGRSDALVGNQRHTSGQCQASDAADTPNSPTSPGAADTPTSPVAADLRVGREVRAAASSTPPRPLPTEFIREILRQLLSALAAAHQAGLVHRDVKSANILLDCRMRTLDTSSGRKGQVAECGASNTETGIPGDVDGQASAPGGVHDPGPSGRTAEGDRTGSLKGGSDSAFRIPHSAFVKLADFGLARMLSARTRMTTTGSVIGTPEYMSPEQARGDEDIDHRTDLYSAGVVLYEMLTGHTPFKADTPSAVIHRILHEDPPHPRTISKHADPHLTALALRLMAKQPEDRFDSAAEAVTALNAHQRVRSRELSRKFRRRLITGSAVLGLALVAVSSVKYFMLSDPLIADVRLDPGTTAPRTVEVQYGDDVTWTRFYDFPADREGYFLDTALVDADGKGRQIVVVGARRPLDEAGSTLIALEPSGEELWRKPVRSEWQWPDVEGGQDYWHVQHVLASELDGVPGDELVVVAQDQDNYPTRVSLVDPGSSDVLSSFWHFGHIEHIEIVPGYFKDGRPALMARGYNNKLDGFADESADGSELFAHWDVVSVLMILDPKKMNGIGPPPTDRLPVAGGNPYTYAFLDRPYHLDALEVTVVGGTRRATRVASLAPHETSYIESVVMELRDVKDGTGPWLRVSNMYSREPEPPDSHRALIVDRNLNLREMSPSPPHLHNERATKEYWDQYWHPIIQNGQYVRE